MRVGGSGGVGGALRGAAVPPTPGPAGPSMARRSDKVLRSTQNCARFCILGGRAFFLTKEGFSQTRFSPINQARICHPDECCWTKNLPRLKRARISLPGPLGQALPASSPVFNEATVGDFAASLPAFCVSQTRVFAFAQKPPSGPPSIIHDTQFVSVSVLGLFQAPLWEKPPSKILTPGGHTFRQHIISHTVPPDQPGEGGHRGDAPDSDLAQHLLGRKKCGIFLGTNSVGWMGRGALKPQLAAVQKEVENHQGARDLLLWCILRTTFLPTPSTCSEV